jgi:hypothetical protein
MPTFMFARFITLSSLSQVIEIARELLRRASLICEKSTSPWNFVVFFQDKPKRNNCRQENACLQKCFATTTALAVMQGEETRLWVYSCFRTRDYERQQDVYTTSCGGF